ncbi:unnamed protein product [Heterobilharzia americana]|nr:unnamed protein product [Heterobilharzia americana]
MNDSTNTLWRNSEHKDIDDNNNKDKKTNRSKSIPNRSSIINVSPINHNKILKTESNNRNSRRRRRKINQFNHIRLHSYDENMKKYPNELNYYEEIELGTDVTYLPLSDFTNSIHQVNNVNKTIRPTTNPTTTTTTTTNNNNNISSNNNITVETTRQLFNNGDDRKEYIKSLPLPMQLPPPPSLAQAKMIHQHFKPTLTIQSSTISSKQTKNNVNQLTNNLSNMIPTIVDNYEKIRSDNFQLLIDLNNEMVYDELNCQQWQEFSPSQNYHQGQQEAHIKLESNVDNNLILFPERRITYPDNTNPNNIQLQCKLNCLKFEEPEKSTYRTPTAGMPKDGNKVKNENQRTSSTKIVNSNIVRDPVNNNNSINNYYLSYRPSSSNVHFNTSSSNSGQTLIGPDVGQQYRRFVSHRSLDRWRQFHLLPHEHNTIEDDTTLIHSIFAVVAARLRTKRNRSRAIIKKISEYDKLYQDNDNNNNVNNAKTQTTGKQIHQHIKLDKDEQQLWRLCIKLNPKDLPKSSTLTPVNSLHDDNTNAVNTTESTNDYQSIQLKKTHILATLGKKVDKGPYGVISQHYRYPP